MGTNKINNNPVIDLRSQPDMVFENLQIPFEKIEMQKLLDEFQQSDIENNPQLFSLLSRYRTIYDCAPTAFLILDQQGFIVDVNRATCILFNYAKDALKGLNITKIIHTKDLPQFALFLQNTLNYQEKQSIEFRIKPKNGELISVFCHSCTHNIDDGRHEFFLTLQDISKQKLAEKAIFLLNNELEKKVYAQTFELVKKNKSLREKIAEIKKSKQLIYNREAKLKSVFNANLEGIIIIRDTGDIESVNQAVSNIFGYPSNELIGNGINKLIPSRQHALQNNFFHVYLEKHQEDIMGKILELEGQKKDGSVIPIDISVASYTLAHIQYFTCIIRDISERKAKELLDKQHLDELAHVTRLGLMGEMASGIAHEVNQPLTAIATYCHVCLRLMKQSNPDLKSLYETLEKTEQQALRAGKIIARMREFVVSNTTSRSYSDINTLVNHALELASDDCQRFDIEQKIELAENIPFVNVDSIQIEQVLLNLIKNSIDALTKSPKILPRRLSIQTYLINNETIEVRVKDNGQGISKEAQAKIFTPFYTTKESGMGMGLSICRSLINAHNGEMRFNCNKDKGTTFYFTLPINEVGTENG